jgi:hypothetical protein
MKGIVYALFVAVLGIATSHADTIQSAQKRSVAEVGLRTINAKLVAYVKRIAADSVVTGEEMRNLIEGIEWFRDEKEEADSVCAESGERTTGTELISGLFAVASSYRIPFVRHRDTDACIVQSTLSRISGVPIRSVEDDIQGASIFFVMLVGAALVALFVYGVYRNLVRYPVVATTLALIGYLLLVGRW